MKNLLANLGSKKLLVTVAGLLGISNLSDVDSTANIVCAAYAMAQGFADGLAKKQ